MSDCEYDRLSNSTDADVHDISVIYHEAFATFSFTIASLVAVVRVDRLASAFLSGAFPSGAIVIAVVHTSIVLGVLFVVVQLVDVAIVFLVELRRLASQPDASESRIYDHIACSSAASGVIALRHAPSGSRCPRSRCRSRCQQH